MQVHHLTVTSPFESIVLVSTNAMLLLRAHHPKTTVEECIVVLSGDGMVDLFQKGDLGIAAVPVETNVVKVECLYCAHRIHCGYLGRCASYTLWLPRSHAEMWSIQMLKLKTLLGPNDIRSMPWLNHHMHHSL